MVATVDSALKWWAKVQPDTPAIIAPGRSVSYAELDRHATAIGSWLAENGVEAGDRVGILAGNSLEWCLVARGITRAGAIVTPFSARMTATEVAELIADYTPGIVLVDHDRAAIAEEACRSGTSRVISLSDLPTGADSLTTQLLPSSFPTMPPEAPIVIISTSGSTARPKGVVHSNRSLVAYATELALAEPEWARRSRLLLVAPLSTSAGFLVLTQYLTLGATVFLEPAFEAERALHLIEQERISIMMGAPIFFERLSALPGFAAADLSSLRLVCTGGARVSMPLLQAWLAKNVYIRQIYGQTEAGGFCTINSAHMAIEGPEKCGHGAIFTEIAIIDEAGKPVPAGTQGQIVIRGPCIMEGYWNRPEETAATLVDGWLRTGDLGVVDENGYLTMVDRMKDIIISGGLNISAAEVERVISELPGVEEIAVISARDDKFGETPLAIIYGPPPRR